MPKPLSNLENATSNLNHTIFCPLYSFRIKKLLPLIIQIPCLFLRMRFHCLAGIKVRVYCHVGKENQGKFALDVAVKTLGLYKEYVFVLFLLTHNCRLILKIFMVWANKKSYPICCFNYTLVMHHMVIFLPMQLIVLSRGFKPSTAFLEL